jgi:simple sugar transport system ATP-binding protein
MADRCTIIRRGKWIDTVEVDAVSETELAEKMVGRPVSFAVAKGPFRPGEIVLAVKDLRVRCNRGLPRLKGLSLEVRAGEILGLAGVDGNGQSELVEALTGLRRVESGGVFFRGEEITNRSPREILDRGIATIPEDRQRRGLVADFSVAENLVLERVRRKPFSKWGILDRKAIRAFAEELIRRFDVRPPAAQHLAKALSGGNQQKVIIAGKCRPIRSCSSPPSRPGGSTWEPSNTCTACLRRNGTGERRCFWSLWSWRRSSLWRTALP